MYLDDDLSRRLDQAVIRFNKRSRATIAQEILETYFDFWLEAEQAKQAIIEAQREKLGKGPAATETATKTKTR